MRKLLMLIQLSRHAIWLPLCLGLVIGIGGYSATHGSVALYDPSLYVQCIIYVLVFCLLFPLLFALQEKVSCASECNNTDEVFDINAVDDTHKIKESRGVIPPGVSQRLSKLTKFEHDLHLSSLLCDALRIFMCWLPYIILLYPGILYWDTGDQVAQFFGISAFGQEPGQIWNHHPFLDTYFYGSVIWIGYVITGSYEVGMFLLSVVHAFLASIAVSAMLAYLYRRGIIHRILSVITAVFCFFPLFPIMFASIVKDTTFAIALIAWFTMYLLLVDSNLTRIVRPGFFVGFVVLSLLVSLTKSIGLYVLVVSMLLLVIGKFKTLLKSICVVLALACFAFVSIFLPKVVFPRLNIVPGERHAAIVVPIQMVARVAHDNPSDITDWEKQALNEYLPMSWDEMGERYVPFSADPVTGYAIKDTGSILDFAKAWLSIGLKHPCAYLQAFISVESGWISFNSAPENNIEPQPPYPEIALQYQPLTENTLNDSTFGQLVPHREPSAGQAIVKGVVHALQDLPILNVFMYLTVWSIIVPIYLLYALLRRHSGLDWIIRYIPYWSVTAFLFLCPVTIQLQNDTSSPTRYAFLMLVMGVVMIGLDLSRTINMTENKHF